jgi:hypothetical protein
VSRGTKTRAAPAVSLCTVITPWLVKNSNILGIIYWASFIGHREIRALLRRPIHGDLADIVNSQ